METVAWQDRDDGRWIRLEGELDNPAVRDVRTSFDEAVDGADRDVVIDLDRVSFVTSLGVGMLIDAKERLKDSGRRVKLSGVNDKVRNSLRMMALHDAFEEV